MRDDLGNAELASLEPQPRHVEQRFEIDGRLAITVGEFVAQLVEIVFGACGGEFLVRFQSQFVRIDVVDGNGRLDRQVDGDGNRFLAFRLLVLFDRFGHHTHVQVEADAFDMAALLIAQQIAGAAQFEILHGYVEARAERGVLRDGGEPVMRLLGHRLGRII